MPALIPSATGATADATARLRLHLAAGLTLHDDPGLPLRLRRTLRVARTVGAPLAPAVDAAIEAQDDAARAERAVQVASAQTRVVAGGLLLAPVVLVPGLGRLLGADLLGFYTSSLGLLVLTVGLGLLAAGAGLVVVLLRRVRRRPNRGAPSASSLSRRAQGSGGLGVTVGRVGATAGGRGVVHVGVAAGVGVVALWLIVGPVAALGLGFAILLAARWTPPVEDPADLEEAAELAATALLGGVTAAAALRMAADEVPALAATLRQLAFDLEVGAPLDLDQPSPGLHQLTELLTTAHDVGAPVAPALRRFAAQQRADDLARVLAAAERLPAQLTFPTALCLLPGTVLLVGAPIVQTGLAAVGT